MSTDENLRSIQKAAENEIHGVPVAGDLLAEIPKAEHAQYAADNRDRSKHPAGTLYGRFVAKLVEVFPDKTERAKIMEQIGVYADSLGDPEISNDKVALYILTNKNLDFLDAEGQSFYLPDKNITLEALGIQGVLSKKSGLQRDLPVDKGAEAFRRA